MHNSEPARTRTLTRNESLVIKSILGSTPKESEEERIRSSGLPRTSYQEAKQRVYSMRFVHDRLIPSPQAIPMYRASLVLVRPFANKVASVSEMFRKVPGTVLIWSGMHTVLGLIFHQTEERDRAFKKELGEMAESGTVISEVTVEPSPTTIPVYFDYEGAWNHFAHTGGSAHYPRAFPWTSTTQSNWQWSLRSTTYSVFALLRRQFEEGDGKRPPNLFSPAALPRSQRRLLLDEVVEHRSFLVPGRIPSLNGIGLGDIVLLSGKLARDGKPDMIIQDLVVKCGAYPFLLFSDGSTVLMGLLAAGSRRKGASGPSSAVSVLGVISNHLSHIEFVRETTDQLNMLRSHRYDLLTMPSRDGEN
jgi:hypothetical protein